MDNVMGYSYFGARYYDSDLSVWLSVDPLSDKYPGLSPYMYVAGNPIVLKDPDGKKIVVHYKDERGYPQYVTVSKPSDIEKLKNIKGFGNQVYTTMDYLRDEQVLIDAINSNKPLHVEEGNVTQFVYKKRNNLKLIYNPTQGLELVDDENAAKPMGERIGTGQIQSPAVGFLHELGHYLHYLLVGRKQHIEDGKSNTEEYGLWHSKEEKRNIEEVETPAAGRLGEPRRTNHSGRPVEVDGPTSTKESDYTYPSRNVRDL